MAIKTQGIETPNFFQALQRCQKEDPTFKVHLDQTSERTIISGMGELHLEIYVERMKREYNVDCTTGKPRVNFRETVTQRAEFNYTHKKQTGLDSTPGLLDTSNPLNMAWNPERMLDLRTL
ncbi:hypothetical protein M378DRAFT_1057194 [Amanita muscaria Koide BX008]|uniref:Elongation Factor G domain-containing protein n=1 Tax=Amanita muscaria (strain Koide BX008) TaxID=946122 RepID=A0A0C2WY28_AMAMK|nr:hypothetical protein M378DRAFT_1057194 [Amanita muscaria Koide BX008]